MSRSSPSRLAAAASPLPRPRVRRLPLLVAGAALALLAAAPAAAVTVTLLSYNVAGLPLGLSSSTPEVNTVLISPLLNEYDLVAVQEDFGFHDDLVSLVGHPHQSVKDTTDTQEAIDLGVELGLGDGLNRLSFTPFGGHQRVTWETCFGIFTNGSDCLAPKGFAVARHEIAPGVEVDVYNLHADAGSDAEDLAVRREQMRQLIAFAQTFSQNRAVVVLGDTNSRYTRDGDILPELLDGLGLTDVWLELSRGGVLPDVGPALQDCIVDGLNGGDCERVDKVFYRSSEDVLVSALDYDVPDARFRDDADVPLSDHEPVVAVLEIIPAPEPSAALSLVAALLALRVLARSSRPEAP